jgi:hypothetical protein
LNRFNISKKKGEDMKSTLKIILAIVISCTLINVAGCAGKPKINQSGFLKDYSYFREDPEELVNWLYIKEGASLGAYDKMIIDHVTFFFKEDADYKGIHPEELIELAKYFHTAFLEALTGAYSFVDKPGSGTLRLRMAVTNLVPGKPVSGTLTTIMPPSLIASHIKKAVTGSHIGMGGVTVEAELVDSQTKEVLTAGIGIKTGKKYKISKSFTKWGQVEEIFNAQAKIFRERLDKLAGR